MEVSDCLGFEMGYKRIIKLKFYIILRYLMPEQPDEVPTILKIKKQSLDRSASVEETIQNIQQIAIILQQLDLSTISKLDLLLYDYLKPVSRQATNLSLSHKNAQNAIEKSLLAVFRLYAKSIRNYFSLSAFQMINELLQRHSQIFRKERQGASAMEMELEEQKQQQEHKIAENKWIKKSQFKNQTPFFYICCIEIMSILEGIEESFPSTNINFVKQFLHFLYYMEDYLKKQYLGEVCQKVLNALEHIFKTAHTDTYKQFCKDVTYQSCYGVMNTALKVLKISGLITLKKNYELAGSIFGVCLLKNSTSIEKKIQGLKIINLWANYFYANPIAYNKQEDYVKWMFENQIINYIYEDPTQVSVIKGSGDILKLFIRKKCLGEDNFHNLFMFIDKATPQIRQIMFKYMDHASTRFDYADYELILGRFLSQKSNIYHEEEAFNLLESIGRYATYSQNRKIQSYLQEIIHEGKFKSSLVENKCVELYITTFGRIIDRNRESDKKIVDFFEFVQPYLATPSSLGVLLIKKGINKLPDIGFLSRSKACHNLVIERNIIEIGLRWLDEIKPKEDVQELISYVLQNAKEYYYEKAKINDSLYYKATKSPRIFEKLIAFLDNSKKIEDLFSKMVSMFAIEKFPFVCLRILFFRLNQTYVYEIVDVQNQYDLRIVAPELKGFENLKYLLLNATDNSTRGEVAEFIAELYTIYSEDRVLEGEEELKKMMKQIIYMTLEEYKSQESPERLLSYLFLIEHFMQATELFGVGDMKSHNSLVPTSTVTVKINNEITYGSDVLKVYEKKVPSNMSLFQLIEEISKQFKCSPSEIMFREGLKMWSERLNGLTLEEIKIDGKTITAVKSFRNKIRKEELLINGELTEKSKKVFEEIYNTFAVDGKMGKKQCANYVAGVTKTSCTTSDLRVSEFFRDYDLDRDDNITVEDFLKFYKANSTYDRDPVVWKNLSTMRYRKDLKKYDDPIEKPPHELLFRYNLVNHPKIYGMLFDLTENDHPDIRQKAMTLLFRLPTCHETLQSFSTSLGLEEKNCFNTEYLLIAVQSYLSEEESREIRIKKFIESGNDKEIFSMMIRISEMMNPTVDERKCLFISLQILRLLVGIPNLRNSIANDFTYIGSIKLQSTNLFIEIAKEALAKLDAEILQSSLALQFTQQNISIEFALQFIFHEEFQIRKIACNYVFVAYKIGKANVNLFGIEPQKYCEYWYEILIKIIEINPSIQLKQIIDHCVGKLNESSQEIEINPDDSVIFGNLSILMAIFYNYPTVKRPQNYLENLVQLGKRLISNRNRRVMYGLMQLEDSDFATSYISKLIKSIEATKEVSLKKNYVGIKNLGAICYMNSILQQLFKVNEFKEIIFSLQNSELQLEEVDGKLIYDDILFQLQKMYTYLQKSKRQHYNPLQFCLTIKDSSGKPINIRIQEDAHEFVGSFFDKLEPYLKKNNRMDDFNKIFGGKTLTQFTCDTCSSKIQRDESFFQLSLEVKNMKQLRDSFKKFIQPEGIDDYFCEPCNKKQKITKETFLSCLPNIIIINLQRIIFDLETFQKAKVDTSFSFPHEINLYEYVYNKNIKEEDCEYELKGIVIHSGTSQSGHYYSIIKEGKEWFKFNDQAISKFDPKDIQREAFGGSETTDQWNDQLKFSTNAYILFYEKKEEMKAEINMNLNEKFELEVENDNEVLYKQVQVHQESIFEFANALYERIRPNIDEAIKVHTFDQNWQSSMYVQKYQQIYQLMLDLLEFSQVFYDVKPDHLFKMGRYLYEFYYLLPEESYKFLMNLDPSSSLQILALHNDDQNRNIYKCLLNKILHVYYYYYGMDLNEDSKAILHIRKFLDTMFDYMKDEKLSKNIFKSTQFFQFWKSNCELIPPIYSYASQRQILVCLIDLLMANESPLLQKGCKRQEVPQYQAIPIIQFVASLMNRKKNLQDYINPNEMVEGVEYETLTENEKNMLGNIKFYRKMIKNRNDNGILGVITSKLSQKDEDFSKKMVELFIKGLNSSYDEMQSSLILINHLKFYLLIDDEFTLKRIKWVMGIPQLQIIDEMHFGLRFAEESNVYSYASPLYFIQSDLYQPALQVLFRKREIYTQFSIEGVNLLLQMLCNSDIFFNYLMSLPAPNYVLRHYADWIEDYIKKLKQESSYYVQFDKNVAYANLSKLYHQFLQKLDKFQVKLPINPYIIGKNKNLEIKASAGNADYEMALWAHETYILPNLPTGFSNKSLPKQLFKFSEPLDYAVHFVGIHKKKVEDDEKLQSKWTMYTLEVDSKKKLKLVFNFHHFKEELYIDKGQIRINFPYEDFQGPISQFIQVIPLEESEMKTNIIQQIKDEYYPSLLDQDEPKGYAGGDMMGGKECPTCTYVNYGRQMCEMCDNPLF